MFTTQSIVDTTQSLYQLAALAESVLGFVVWKNPVIYGLLFLSKQGSVSEIAI